MSEKWHKGSRYWRLSQQVVVMAFAIVAACILFRPESVREAVLMFGTIGGAVIGGGAWQNAKERHPDNLAAIREGEG